MGRGTVAWRVGRSVGRRVAAPDAAAGPLGPRAAAGVDAGAVGRQAAPAGPAPQPLDRLARRDRHRHDVLRRVDQRDVQQRRQAAAARSGPVNRYRGRGPLLVDRLGLRPSPSADATPPPPRCRPASARSGPPSGPWAWAPAHTPCSPPPGR